jgi:hypothetical protein
MIELVGNSFRVEASVAVGHAQRHSRMVLVCSQDGWGRKVSWIVVPEPPQPVKVPGCVHAEKSSALGAARSGGVEAHGG